MSIRDFFQKTLKKNLTDSKPLNSICYFYAVYSWMLFLTVYKYVWQTPDLYHIVVANLTHIIIAVAVFMYYLQ